MADPLLLHGARSLVGAPERSWILIEEGRIAGMGRPGHEPRAARPVDVDGAVLGPAYCDAHVHLGATGLLAAGVDLTAVATVDEVLARLAAVPPGRAELFGHGFDDPLDRPLSARDIDGVVGDRAVLLAQADLHTCVVSSKILHALDLADLEGVERSEEVPTGRLSERAAGAAFRWFDAHLSPATQVEALEAAAQLAYGRGIAEVHEMFVPEWRDEGGLDLSLSTVEPLALRVVSYVALDDVRPVAERGLVQVGGDWFLDGSFGSHTAWLMEPYSDLPSDEASRGMEYRTDDEVMHLFSAAQSGGLQVAVHAIGDAAIDQALRIWERIAARDGIAKIRALRHRIEHFEVANDLAFRRAARLGLGLCVQPAFDLMWGGPEGLYSKRIGWDRARVMNRFASMVKAGLNVGVGSDSIVTPMDPNLQMASLRDHHVPEERLDAETAHRLHTSGAFGLAPGADRLAGTLTLGAPGHLVALDRDPLTASTVELRATEVLGTWIGGMRVWPPHLREE
ncbi:MAG TPA: amidohydrolase family protein [Actinomycetota bacterium]|nr:amidohydrolase family protein [Actinomycetota bacterium]